MDIYRQGYFAFQGGKSLSDCPYSRVSEPIASHRWEEGYHNAEAKAKASTVPPNQSVWHVHAWAGPHSDLSIATPVPETIMIPLNHKVRVPDGSWWRYGFFGGTFYWSEIKED